MKAVLVMRRGDVSVWLSRVFMINVARGEQDSARSCAKREAVLDHPSAMLCKLYVLRM